MLYICTYGFYGFSNEYHHGKSGLEVLTSFVIICKIPMVASYRIYLNMCA